MAFIVVWLSQLTAALVVVAICVSVEYVAALERFTLRQRWGGFVILLAGTLSSALMGWLLQMLWGRLGIGHYIIVPVAYWLSPFGVAGAVLSFFISVAAFDFFTYWRHRAEHKWFWPIHSTHHSPTELHALSNWGHPLAVVPNFLFVSIPVSLIQMPGTIAGPAAIALLMSFLGTYIHSPVDFHFGPLRHIVVDNRFHRIHHSTEEQHFERNFGALFSFWDALFGTAYWPKRGEWPEVGIDRLPPANISEFLMYPFSTLSFGGGGLRLRKSP